MYPFNLARQRICKLHPAIKSVLMPPTFHTPPRSLLQLFYSFSSSHPPSPYPALRLTHHPPASNPSIHPKQHEDPTCTPSPIYSHVNIPTHAATSFPHSKSLTSKRDVSHDTQLAPHALPMKPLTAQLLVRR